MNSAITLRRLLVLAVAILPAATAQICTPENIRFRRSTYEVITQSDLDKIAKECTAVNGTIEVRVDYNGSFKLPNVKNITSIVSELSGRYSKITSVDLPDLEFIDEDLEIYAPELDQFSAPKLKTIGSKLTLRHAQRVNLKSLEKVPRLDIGGEESANITSLQFDSLKRVSENCRITKTVYSKRENSPLDLSFPSLETAGSLSVYGSLSSFNMPKLSKLTAGTAQALIINATGETVDLSFPELRDLSRNPTYLRGDIASLSMPKLYATSRFLVDAYIPLDIKLYFERTENIELHGNISSVEFPNLKSSGRIQVESDLELDCNAFRSAMKETVYIDDILLSCTSPRKPDSSSSLIVRANAALGAVVAVIALLVTF